MYVRSIVHSCGQDIAITMKLRMAKLSVYTYYGKGRKPIRFQGHRILAPGSLSV